MSLHLVRDFTVKFHGTREEWLHGRSEGVGASESAAIFRQSPFTSSFKLWAEKCGHLPDAVDEPERLYWGSKIEPLVAEECVHRFGWKIVDLGRWTICRSNEWPWMCASLDRIIEPFDERGPGVLECKNTSAYMRDDWNESGTPLYIQIQGQHQLAVTGYRWGAFAVLIGGCEFRMIEFERNDEFIRETLVPECERFWRSVLAGEQPEVDGSDATTTALKRLYPAATGPMVQLPHEAIDWDRKIREAQEEKKKAEAIEEEAKNRIRQALGGAEAGELPDGSARWTWRAGKKSARTLRRAEGGARR